MPRTLLARASVIQALLAVPVLGIPLVVYLLAWNWEPYVFAYSVLALAPLQLIWSLTGALFAATGDSNSSAVLSLVLSVALAASALGAFFALRTINWA